MIDCEEFLDNVSAFIEKDLRFPEILECEKHLAACGPCKGLYREVKRLMDKLGNMSRVKTQEGFNDKLMDKIGDRKARKAYQSKKGWRLPDINISFRISINWANN